MRLSSEKIDRAFEKKNIFEIYESVNADTENVMSIAEDNEEYLKYLKTKNTSLGDWRLYIGKMSQFRDDFLKTFLYVLCLVILAKIAPVARKTFYLYAGMFYFVLMLVYFFSGYIETIISIDLNLLEPFKEGIVTFIFFDTLMQINENSIKGRIIYIQETLKMQEEYIKTNVSNNVIGNIKCIRDIIVDVNKIIKKLKREIWITFFKYIFDEFLVITGAVILLIAVIKYNGLDIVNFGFIAIVLGTIFDIIFIKGHFDDLEPSIKKHKELQNALEQLKTGKTIEKEKYMRIVDNILEKLDESKITHELCE